MSATSLLIGVLRAMNSRSEEYEQRLRLSKVRRAMARVAIQCVGREETLRGLIHQVIEQRVDYEEDRVAMRAQCEELMLSFFSDLSVREAELGAQDSKAVLAFQREWVERKIAEIEAEEGKYVDSMVFQLDDLNDLEVVVEPPK